MKKTDKSWQPWKGSEIRWLRDNIQNMTIRQAAGILGRTEAAVTRFAQKYGIKARRKGRPRIYDLDE